VEDFREWGWRKDGKKEKKKTNPDHITPKANPFFFINHSSTIAVEESVVA